MATPSLAADLAAKGFTKLRPWTRGVDTELFNPAHRGDLGLPGPVFLYVGRVAVEKNLRAFLDLELPGSKVVVGDGPALADLKSRYPRAIFMGEHTGADLARIYASSDVFVFPSRTDTFGIVLLEALASGVPVAAYPVTGPIDVRWRRHRRRTVRGFARGRAGRAQHRPGAARQKALGYSWPACAELFLKHIQAVHADTAR